MENNLALQTALELSMLNLNNTTYSTASPDPPFGLLEDDIPLESRVKTQNVTQCVNVPSSEHVAEIVGRQGCKIKALRAKTNTYIKTPVRGEEPIFIITGRPEDVGSARKEILSAADHFTQIRARRASVHSLPVDKVGSVPNVEDNNRVTIMVRVPYRVVGLVVGPKGTTVKRIQQLTNTYIVTPSRDKDPCFEVRGSPDNVERAKKEIESYIALRTGGSPEAESDYYQQGSGGVETFISSTVNLMNRRMAESGKMGMEQAFIRHDERRMSPLSSAVFSAEHDHVINVPMPEHLVPMSAPALSADRIFDFSSFNEGLQFVNPPSHPLAVNPPPRDGPKPHPPSPTYSWESNSSDGLSMNSPKQKSMPQALFHGSMPSQSCCVCHDKQVVAALVPCGHNLFCMSCANYVAEYVRRCPVCQTQVNNALRIHTR